jgi:preprotein translocase subunit YajC
MIFNLLFFAEADTVKSGSSAGSLFSSPLIMIALMFVVLWFFMIRPQQKKQKELREMRKKLDKGDKIITQGGIHGVIVDVKESYFVVEVDTNVKLRIAKDLVYKDLSEMPQK